ncbi:MAG: hypothetical protein RR867_07815, partial [Ruthenibacterium sp.]
IRNGQDRSLQRIAINDAIKPTERCNAINGARPRRKFSAAIKGNECEIAWKILQTSCNICEIKYNM